MPRAVLAAALFSTLAVPAVAQEARPSAPAPLQTTAQQDHKLMMEAMGIKSLREGANGMNPRAANAANYDESKANFYPDLPDPLVLMEFGFGGFGPRPGGPAGKAATSKAGDSPQARATPKAGPGGFGGGGPTWQQQVLARGWGYAVIVPSSIQADNGAGLTGGIIGLCNKGQPRKPDDWGALRAWAWGASRALDYFETDKAVDAGRVGIEGLSRYGKAALVAMAYDRRFAIGFIGSSGEGGAKLHRRNFGELVENLTSSGEYHWMAGNFLKYGGPLTPNNLPVDAHELIALCAPRPAFISYGASSGPGAEGQWVDQRGSFMAAVAAGPAYDLLGKKGLGTADFPEVETGLTDGEIAFRQHRGGHTTGPNWPTFLAFADRYFKASHAPAPDGR